MTLKRLGVLKHMSPGVIGVKLLREATKKDIDILTVHHKLMFLEISKLEGMSIDNLVYDKMVKKYREKLIRQFPNDTCKAWLIEEDNNVIASAAISLYHGVPTPFDTNVEIGFLHSVYTEKPYRRMGYAKILVKYAMEHCFKLGINRIDLAASGAGRKIYESLGFKPSTNAMRYLRK
ncbi:MAG: GNAT family N-acetyltransferase [Chitinispirillia bacterium]|jgi:GNAT superfamily N-acetyltransferase